MSSADYLIWFIATAVMTVVVMGGGIAFATGMFDKTERLRRKARHDAELAARSRLEVPTQRAGSDAASRSAGDLRTSGRRPG